MNYKSSYIYDTHHGHANLQHMKILKGRFLSRGHNSKSEGYIPLHKKVPNLPKVNIQLP